MTNEGYHTGDTGNGAEQLSAPGDSGTQEVTLTGYQAYVAEQLEQLVTLQEASLESQMRLYDCLITMITLMNSGDRTMEYGLREQHANGQYYFPPFNLTENIDGQERDSSQD